MSENRVRSEENPIRRSTQEELSSPADEVVQTHNMAAKEVIHLSRDNIVTHMKSTKVWSQLVETRVNYLDTNGDSHVQRGTETKPYET